MRPVHNSRKNQLYTYLTYEEQAFDRVFCIAIALIVILTCMDLTMIPLCTTLLVMNEISKLRTLQLLRSQGGLEAVV